MKLRFLHGDLVVWAVFFFLCVISFVEVFSAGSYLYLEAGRSLRPFFQHGFFLSMAALMAWVVHNIPSRWFKLIPLFGLPLSIILLLWALFFGQNLNSGARWVSIMGLSFQPSEVAKGALIATVALILATKQRDLATRRSSFKPILIVTFLICGLIVTQNFSTAALLFLVVCIMMFLGRVPNKWLLVLFGSLSVLGLLGFITLKSLPKDPYHPIYDNTFMQRVPTWRARFDETVVITPDPKDFVVNDRNRQVVHARIALARANVTGLAPGRSVQRDYLSAAYSDFIFAIIAEEMGIIGCAFVLFLYLVLLYRVGRIASRCKHNFPAFLVLGLGVMLVLQALVNMLVAVGAGPVTGQPLPLISKGGTSTIITGFYIGMILSVSRASRRDDLTPLRSLAAEQNKEVEAAFAKE
ncbi:MAG: FtsW/RodA/SpoVE family cell cycle protein [Bacteroidales bacterium]|nr:FtsW/RodA/SpoVE family cell cycle protein [Bacteroidales bacterium]